MIEDKISCPCCGSLTLNKNDFPGSYDICPVCWWEDDNVQYKNPDMAGGANKMSLNQARENFKKYGACDKTYVTKVRAPKPEEIPTKLNNER